MGRRWPRAPRTMLCGCSAEKVGCRGGLAGRVVVAVCAGCSRVLLLLLRTVPCLVGSGTHIPAPTQPHHLAPAAPTLAPCPAMQACCGHCFQGTAAWSWRCAGTSAATCCSQVHRGLLALEPAWLARRCLGAGAACCSCSTAQLLASGCYRATAQRCNAPASRPLCCRLVGWQPDCVGRQGRAAEQAVLAPRRAHRGCRLAQQHHVCLVLPGARCWQPLLAAAAGMRCWHALLSSAGA